MRDRITNSSMKKLNRLSKSNLLRKLENWSTNCKEITIIWTNCRINCKNLKWVLIIYMMRRIYFKNSVWMIWNFTKENRKECRICSVGCFWFSLRRGFRIIAKITNLDYWKRSWSNVEIYLTIYNILYRKM